MPDPTPTRRRSSRPNKRLAQLVSLAVSAAILTYVVRQASADQSFQRLADQPKNWSILLLAWVCCMAAVVTTIIRWYMLVRALGLPFRLRDAFRLGFLGYLFNFVSVGSVGGDLFKAIFIAREHPGRRAEAVATVVVDRVIGLYGMFVLASLGILLTGQLASDVRQVRVICSVALACTGLGGIAVLMVLVPGFTYGAVSEMLRGIPKIGATFGKLIDAVRMYRRQPRVLVAAGVMSLGVHSFITIGLYLVAVGLPGDVHPLSAHFVIVPMSMVSGVLPLPFMGLGAFEFAINFLYENLPTGVAVAGGQGLLVALGYRIITIGIAAVGVVVYLASHRELADLMHEAQHEAELEAGPTTTHGDRPPPLEHEQAQDARSPSGRRSG